MIGLAAGVRGWGWAAVLSLAGMAAGQDAPGPSRPQESSQQPSQPEQQPQPVQAVTPGSGGVLPGANYDPAMFLKPIPVNQLSFLAQYDGRESGELWRDKQFRRLVKSMAPGGMFHYGYDMPVNDALDRVFTGSRVPVEVRDGRYLMAAGTMGQMLGGRGFVWIDLKTGIALGGLYFHPTNGEPTPALNVFSRQVKEDNIALSELPPEFVSDMIQWQTRVGPPAVSARYFLTGDDRKIVLEHDEDYCLAADGTKLPPESGCREMAADAADLDLTEAYYVDATHHAMNATAWMMSQDQVAFIQVRDRTCRVGPDPLGCRIVMTRERTRSILKNGARQGPVRPVRR